MQQRTEKGIQNLSVELERKQRVHSHPVCNIPILNYQVQKFLSPQPPVLPVLNLQGYPIMFNVRWKSAHDMDILDKKLVIQENFSPAHKLLIFT